MTDYLKKILTARVYDVAIESPLEPAPNLSKRTKNHILLKREDMQSVFSFKLRGAYNKMANLSASQLGKGVICASAGNHAQGVALSARKLDCKAVIAMPTPTPPSKLKQSGHTEATTLKSFFSAILFPIPAITRKCLKKNVT